MPNSDRLNGDRPNSNGNSMAQEPINSGAGGSDHPRLPHNGLYMEVNQVQKQPPSDYENRLADAIEAAFKNGAHELPALVTALNASGVAAPDGSPWNVDTFAAVMASLNA
jgi:hypothetical protein